MRRILILGTHIESYPRNRILVRALSSVFESTTIHLPNTFFAHWTLLKTVLVQSGTYDSIILIQPAARFAPTLFLLRPFIRSKIIFDAFTSIYDSYVADRRLVSSRSPKAAYYFLLDFLSVHAADTLFFDTEEHRDFFLQKFGGKKKKTLVVPVSVDLEHIESVEKDTKLIPKEVSGAFTVFFSGYYIPLQGVEYIVEAARLLQNEEGIHFVFLGSGQTKDAILKSAEGLQNVSFIPRVSYDELLGTIKSAHVSLGIFGSTQKALRVIPNKVLESAACRTAVITGKNEPLSRFFTDKRSILFVPMQDSSALAQKILEVYKNKYNLSEITEYAHAVVAQNFSQKSITSLLSTLSK